MNILLQIETVGPEGYKLIWIFPGIVVIAFVIWVIVLNRWRSWFSFETIKVEAGKNKIYHPETVSLLVKNKKKEAVVIESVNLTFKSLRAKRSFLIKRVAGRKIYPLFLDAGNNHSLVIALEPFYSKFPELKKKSRLRLEVNTEKGKIYRTRYLLLKPTLFRSNR